MVWNFAETDSITGFVSAIYGKGLNLIKTDSVTDLGTAIYSKGLSFTKRQTLLEPAAKNKLCHTLYHCYF